MEDGNINTAERLKKILDALIEIDKEAEALAREGRDVRRDIGRYLDKAKLQNVAKIIETIN